MKKILTLKEIMGRLNECSSEKYKENISKLGIPKEGCIGVSTSDVRKIAKEIKKDNKLAKELWLSGYHEAKLLAVLVMDKNQTSLVDVEAMMNDVISWDLCDHLCKNLIVKMPEYNGLINKWCEHVKTYYRRGGFTLMASAAIHDKQLDSETIDMFLHQIRNSSDDEREHVKKAVSWALREIGKIDFTYQEKAIGLAYEFIETGTKNQRWIGKDALKELETLVKVEGRQRLISSKSKMGSSKYNR